MACINEMVREKLNRNNFIAYPAQEGNVDWLAMIALRAEFIFNSPKPDQATCWTLEKPLSFASWIRCCGANASMSYVLSATANSVTAHAPPKICGSPALTRIP